MTRRGGACGAPAFCRLRPCELTPRTYPSDRQGAGILPALKFAHSADISRFECTLHRSAPLSHPWPAGFDRYLTTYARFQGSASLADNVSLFGYCVQTNGGVPPSIRLGEASAQGVAGDSKGRHAHHRPLAGLGDGGEGGVYLKFVRVSAVHRVPT